MATTSPEPTSGMLAPLRRRDFRLLFTGQTVSLIGDQIFPVAVALKVLDAGGSAGDLGLVLAGKAASMVLLLALAGVIADRLSRTRVMVLADAFHIVAVLGLAAVPGDVPVWGLALLTFAVGGGEAFFRPAYGALVPSVLPEHELSAGNALASVSYKTSVLLGPGIGALAVALGGPRTAFLLDAATFVVSLLTLLRIAEPPLAVRERRAVLAEARDGVRAVRQRPWIGALLVMASLQVLLTIAPYVVLLPVIARERLGGNDVYAGVLTVFAVGGLLGALVGARWRPKLPGLWAMLGLLPHGGLMLSLAYADSALPVLVWAAVAGLGLEPFLVWWSTALQRDVPRDLLARVISLDWMVSLGLLPVGLALVGPAVELVGQPAVLWTGAVAVVATSLAVLLVPGVAELATPRAQQSRAQVWRGRVRPGDVRPKP